MESLVIQFEGLAGRPPGKRKRDPGSIDQVLGNIIKLCYVDTRALAEP